MITTRTIPIDDGPQPTVLRAHCAGTGPLALLLHGYPLDHRMWLDTLRSPLARRRTLCALDQRGHGESPFAGDAVHTMERLADDAAAVIRSLTDDPVDVVGLSMGGYVAFALWARHPQLVRSLVLSNTRAGADGHQARAGRDMAVATVLDKGRAAIADAMLPKLLAPDADAMVRARVRTMIEGTPVETIVADLRGLKDRADRVAMLGSITVPTLCVVGELDPITPVAEADVMANGIAGALRVVVPGAAHMTPMEQPAAFAAAVGAFWR